MQSDNCTTLSIFYIKIHAKTPTAAVFSTFVNLFSGCWAVSAFIMSVEQVLLFPPPSPPALFFAFLRQCRVWETLSCGAASSVQEPSCAAVLVRVAPRPMHFFLCEGEILCAVACVCFCLLDGYACGAVERAIVPSLGARVTATRQRPCQWCFLMAFRFNFHIIM